MAFLMDTYDINANTNGLIIEQFLNFFPDLDS